MARRKKTSATDREARRRSDRRSFLSRSLVASGALLAAPSTLAAGCGASLSSAMASGEMRDSMDRLERGLGTIRAIPPGTIARQLTWMSRPELSERILRQALEGLVVADVTRSLPAGERLPRPLAARLVRELPAFEHSTRTHHALLARMPDRARRQLDERIRREPDITMEIAGWLDEHADELGTARESRLQLRIAARDVQSRLRRQSANAVVDDCVAKVERVMARSGNSLAFARSSMVPAMIDAIWQEVDGVPSEGGTSLAAPGRALPRPPGQQHFEDDMEWSRFMDQSNRFWSARWRRPGDEELLIGPALMPFGSVTCGVLLIAGLIVLLVGAVQNANWDGVPRDVH